MSEMSNLIILVIFAGMAFFMGKGYFSCRKKVVIKDRMWSANRVLFAIAGLMSFMTLFMYQTVMDGIRLAIMMVAIVLYLLTRDGIGEEGIVSFGRFSSWSEVRNYDYKQGKKTFDVYLVMKDQKASDENYTVVIHFDPKQEKEVVAYLKDKIGRKYTRLKK